VEPLSLAASIRQGWMGLMANTPAYYYTEKNTAVKSFVYPPVAWPVEQQ